VTEWLLDDEWRQYATRLDDGRNRLRSMFAPRSRANRLRIGYIVIAIRFFGEKPMMVSTTNEVAGYRVVRHLGLVRGITVRSRSVVGNFFGGLQTIFGGKLSVYVNLAETTRQEAFDHMCQHAAEAGANAIIGMRYDANEIMDGVTEVLAYGTAVIVERA
jgi:uncharacterized protein YbjQ (UPF0145 family)